MIKRIIIFVAIGFAVIGGIFLTIGIVKLVKNTKVESGNLVTHDVSESFSSINIDVDTTKITFYDVSDDKVKVEAEETEKQYFTVEVVDNVLTIKQVDKRKFIEKWFLNLNKTLNIFKH